MWSAVMRLADSHEPNEAHENSQEAFIIREDKWQGTWIVRTDTSEMRQDTTETCNSAKCSFCSTHNAYRKHTKVYLSKLIESWWNPDLSLPAVSFTRIHHSIFAIRGQIPFYIGSCIYHFPISIFHFQYHHDGNEESRFHCTSFH
jgi:hypothetical protein